MKEARREDIHVIFLYRKTLFLNHNIFHKLLSNKEILVVL